MSVMRDRRRKGAPWIYDFWVVGQRYQGDCFDDDGVPAKDKQQAQDIQAVRRKAAKQEQALARSGCGATPTP